MSKIEVGQKLFCNGYPGVVTEVHEGQLKGLATVELDSGSIIIDIDELLRFKDYDRRTPRIWDELSLEWYGVKYRELPDDGAQQESIVLEAERRVLEVKKETR